MKTILWLSNHRFSDCPDSATGTWLGAMGRGLVRSGKIRLFNITTGNVSAVTREECAGVVQWVLPQRWQAGATGIPDSAHVQEIRKIVDTLRPDLLHVWGLENYFCVLVARRLLGEFPSLIDIQGIRYAIAPFYMGGLQGEEIRQCTRLKEWLKPACSISARQRRFASFRTLEEEVIGAFPNISYQSEWTHGHLLMLNPRARMFKTVRMLRAEFRSASPWRSPHQATPVIFATCGAGTPYKGLHVLLRALAALKRSGRFPEGLKLRVAGDLGGKGLRRCGYSKFIDRQIETLGLKNDVEFLGPLPATRLIKEMQAADVFVHPSFIESYSLAVAEAMSVGMPCVISSAGAMPELAEEGRSALYYPMGDEVSCARRILEILSDGELAARLGNAAAEKAAERNDSEDVLRRQLEIYEEVLDK